MHDTIRVNIVGQLSIFEIKNQLIEFTSDSDALELPDLDVNVKSNEFLIQVQTEPFLRSVLSDA